MVLKTTLAAASVSLLSLPALAGEISIQNAYARSGAKSGAAFFIISNGSGEDIHLVGASADVSKRVELHTHIADENGVMKMREIEGGIIVPAGATHELKRGSDHVMFMGLAAPLEQGGEFPLTLHFEKAGDVTITVPVDNKKK